MVTRQIKEKQWDCVYHYITTNGRTAYQSLQYDMEITLSGTKYMIRVQPGNQRKLVALQVREVRPAARGGRPDFILIEDAALLCALLEILIYQAVCAPPRP